MVTFRLEWVVTFPSEQVVTFRPESVVTFERNTHLTVGDDNSTANKLAAVSPVAGFFGSRSKGAEAEWDFAKEEFAALFSSGQAPSVRVLVKIDE